MTERQAKQEYLAEVARLKAEADRLAVVTREAVESDQVKQRDDRNAVQQARIAALTTERDQSIAAHQAALLRESAGRQELLARIAEVHAELEAMVRKYEPERIGEDGTIQPARRN